MINMLKEKIPVRFLCEYFSVGPSSYYYWQAGNASQRRRTKDSICQEIKKIFEDSKETYGSPRIYQDLKDRNITISENTVAKYMKELGLDARLS